MSREWNKKEYHKKGKWSYAIQKVYVPLGSLILERKGSMGGTIETRLMKGTKLMTVQYVEKRFMMKRSAIEQAPDQEIEGTLLIGTESVLNFIANRSSSGHDMVSIFPAFHNGERCWMKLAVWCPAYGNSASGTDEYILAFEDGVKLFLERGVFEFPLK